jgi:hypothetical protein
VLLILAFDCDACQRCSHVHCHAPRLRPPALLSPDTALTGNRLLYSTRLCPPFFVHCLHVCTYEIGTSNGVLYHYGCRWWSCKVVPRLFYHAYKFIRLGCLLAIKILGAVLKKILDKKITLDKRQVDSPNLIWSCLFTAIDLIWANHNCTKVGHYYLGAWLRLWWVMHALKVNSCLCFQSVTGTRKMQHILVTCIGNGWL